MRVVIAPDKFAGTLSALDAALAVAEGWRVVEPGAEIDVCPLSDGGPAFVDVLAEAMPGRMLTLMVAGPLGEPTKGRVLRVGDIAYVESAQACGLHLVPPERREPARATTYGVGELIAAAIADGARQIVIGLGGSATTDGGAGMLAALGATATPAAPGSVPGVPGGPGQADPGPAGSEPGHGPEAGPGPGAGPARPRHADSWPAVAPTGPGEEIIEAVAAIRGAEEAGDAGVPRGPVRDHMSIRLLARGGAALPTVGAVDLTAAWRTVEDVELVAASDVDNPLCGLNGAAAIFGPQKGADRAQVLALDAALEGFARLVDPDLADRPGAGAAGGLGFAIFALGGRFESGIGAVLDAVRLDARTAGADLVITGEGSFDHQSLRGKVPHGVAQTAAAHGVPCVVLAGKVAVGRREMAAANITEAYALVDPPGSEKAAFADAYGELSRLAARVARRWTRGR